METIEADGVDGEEGVEDGKFGDKETIGTAQRLGHDVAASGLDEVAWTRKVAYSRVIEEWSMPQ